MSERVQVETYLPKKTPYSGFDAQKPSWMWGGACGHRRSYEGGWAFHWIDLTDLSCHVGDIG